ncbi:alpha/beta fold hydrolase [Falsiroseomonas oryzae]|uniref:hypothetical protein n=1 Tax=Falsiroseomonas oryzae TaxID=2766473 RepID=UPI0022EB8FDC|nr:hypothetical protein [Roseomonas sp. MO-31]
MLLLPGAPAAQERLPLFEVAETPGLDAAARTNVQRFLRMNLPRVLALGPDGAFGWQALGGTPEEVERRALASCERRSGGLPCQVAVRDLAVVAPDRAWSPAPPPAGARLVSWNHETLPDPRFLWWGPEAARGVLVFAHGRNPDGVDSRGAQPQSWTRRFNNAGYDIWRFDRHPSVDLTARAAAWLRDDLAELRRRGYRRVIVAGQSRGGWNALMMLDTPGLAEVVVAVAPAAHGQAGHPAQARQLDDLRLVVEAAAARETRVAVASFRDDPFDVDPEARAGLLRGLAGRVGALLLLDRPEGVSGHSAGASTAFNDRYGGCLFRFATAEAPPSSC